MWLAPLFTAWTLVVPSAAPPAAPANASALMEALASAGQPPPSIAALPAASGQAALGTGPSPALSPIGREQSATRVDANADGGVGGALRMASTAIAFAILVFGAAMVVRRMKGAAPALGGGRALRVLESQWIGRGQRLVLVCVGGHRILLGASAGGVRSLAVLEGTGEAELARASLRIPGAGEGATFAAIIKDEIGSGDSEPRGVLDIEDLMPSRAERAFEKRPTPRAREPEVIAESARPKRGIGSPRFTAASKEGLQDILQRINGYVGAQRKAV